MTMKKGCFFYTAVAVGLLMMLSSAACAPPAVDTTNNINSGSAIAVAPVVVPPVVVTAPATDSKTIYYDTFNPDVGELRNLWVNNGKGHWIWQRQTSASPGCEDGCLKQTSDDPRALNTLVYVRTPQMDDGVIETKVRMSYDASMYVSQKDYMLFVGTGIVFRLVDENNYYMFRLAGEEGVVLGKMVNGTWYDIANPRRVDFLEGGRIRTSVWYSLKVAVHGSRIKCYINDNPVINTNDSTFSVGKFGLTTFKTMADFEYLKVTER
ncbi:MAG: hypothetical protein HQK89_16175 [Nitrospirae bacterium]|nr:hypothetical protein [Nitrospirota bacterium]